MLKSYMNWAQSSTRRKSSPTDDMYSVTSMSRLRSYSRLLTLAGALLALWVTAGAIEAALSGGDAVIFSRYGVGAIGVIIAMGLMTVTIFLAERLPAVFRLHPVRTGVDDLDEWERDIRRRVSEAVLKRVMVALALGVIVSAFTMIIFKGGRLPALPFYSVFIAMLAATSALLGSAYATIARIVAPTDAV